MRTEQNVSYNVLAHEQFVLQTAGHKTAGRREMCKARFSPLQLTQEVLAWVGKNGRKLHFRALHMKAIPDVVLGRCNPLCFSSCSLILFLFLPLYHLPSALPRSSLGTISVWHSHRASGDFVGCNYQKHLLLAWSCSHWYHGEFYHWLPSRKESGCLNFACCHFLWNPQCLYGYVSFAGDNDFSISLKLLSRNTFCILQNTK